MITVMKIIILPILKTILQLYIPIVKKTFNIKLISETIVVVIYIRIKKYKLKTMNTTEILFYTLFFLPSTFIIGNTIVKDIKEYKQFLKTK